VQSIKNSFQGQQVSAGYASVFQKAVLPAVLVGIGLAVFQQFCGINVVFNFTTTIFESVGFDRDDQLKQTVFIGIVNLLFTLLAMWQVDKLGRKPLMLAGAAALAVLYIISALLLQQKSPAAAWTLLAAIGAYATSLAPVTWVLISEIFPNKVRGAATSVAVISLWLAYALLVFTFPVMAEYMGAYTPFYIYAGICALGFLFIKMKVKETKGKTLEEIEQQLARH
jgi:predicted MFS family arabinose efflux permease